jgi:hypoxanthine-DNA glycosylase
MPGKASLAADQYYAHPQNLFWRILADVTGADAALPYPARTRALQAQGIALWDVLESCERVGSLDSAIDDATISANDFASFYRTHPRINHIFFNGAKAEACYRKHALPLLIQTQALPSCRRLPSTSPANASMSRTHKQDIWKEALTRALADCRTA